MNLCAIGLQDSLPQNVMEAKSLSLKLRKYRHLHTQIDTPTHMPLCVCIYLWPLRAEKNLTPTSSLFPSSKTGSNTHRYFLTDVCLDLFRTENLPPPQAIYSNVSISSSALYTLTHIYLSQKVSGAVSDDLHIKRLVNSFLMATSL